ncbi:hypothetical protein ACDI16_02055 [Oceanobacillus caeni]
MSDKKKKTSPKKKSHLKLRKETYGDMPMEECFKKAFDPYFNPDKNNNYLLNKLG